MREYGSDASIDLAADTANHIDASMSFWKMVGKDYASYEEMYADYKECVIDPVVTVKDANGCKVTALPEGTAYVILDCADIPESVSVISQVYSGSELIKQTQHSAPVNNLSTVKFTDLPAGCTLKIEVLSDELNNNQSGIYRELYVAPGGSASAAGTEAAPVNTLEAALNIVKGINASMTGDIIVNVAPGTYNISETIEIDSAMGGKNGYKVIVRAQDPDNKPVISGGEDLTGKWTKVDGQEYWVADTSATDTRTLYVNDYQATLARTSNQYQGSYIATTEETKEADHHTVDGLKVSKSKFPQGLEDADRLAIVFNVGWANHRFPVESVSYDNQYANLYMTFPYYNEFCREENGLTDTTAPTEDKSFYLENAMELLDEAGEFYFDAANQKMYYYPYANEDMTTVKTVCGVTDILVNIEGSSKNKVNNLQFEGISFKYGAYDTPTEQGAGFDQADAMRLGSAVVAGYGTHLFPAQIQVNYADAVVFTDCEFACLGSNGLAFIEGVSNSAVTGSYFHELSGTGVTIGSFNHGQAMNGMVERSKDISVDNNIFRRCAQEYMGLTAVSLYYASNVNVSHNDIKDLPYTAISIGWGWGYDDPEECGGHTINYNKIENVMQVLSDGSHIYTLGNLRGTQINDNYLIDPGDLKASAIYFDQGTGYTNAYDNVITEATGSSDKWLFARKDVGINNCFAGFNHSDGKAPDSYSDFTEQYYGIADGVTLKGNKIKVSSWSATANKIMAEAGVEDQARLNEIDTYPTWRTIPMMRAPAGN